MTNLKDNIPSHQTTSEIYFTGVYSKAGNQLTNSELKLLIQERKNPTEKKSKHFLSDITGGKYTYISSLYPTTIAGNYLLDYKGIQLQLRLNKSTAEIIKVC